MSTQPHLIEFGEWLPDLPDKSNPGAMIAKNVMPQIKSYCSLPSLASFSDALTGVCLGTFWAQNSANVVNNFAGDATKLYSLSAGVTWSDISGASGPFSVDNWEFAKFGERIIAVNSAAATQKYDMGTDSVFSALAGSPPQAQRCAIVRDFVMLGDVTGLGPNYVQWSGFNNSETWTPSISTQSDFQPIYGRGGRVQKIVPGQYGVIFLEQSIFRADYVGPRMIFEIKEVERQRGTPAADSVAWSGTNVWYYGWDGFYHFDGQQSTPISANRVAKWFSKNAAGDALASMRAVVDRRNRLVIWSFKSSTSAAINDRLILYNWAADKWAYAEIDTEILAEYVSPGFTLDELDTPLSSGIDTDSISVDSDQYIGGNVGVMAFDSAHKSATFSGAALSSCIETKEISGDNGRRLVVNSIGPEVQSATNADITVQVGWRNSRNDNVNFTAAKAVNTLNDEANIIVNAKYQRYRVNVAGGFSHGDGVVAHLTNFGGRK